MSPEQAQAQTPANPQQGAQAGTPANGSVSPELQQFIASQTPNVPATPEDAQAQGQPAPAIEAQPDPVKDLQRIANERQVEIYKLQQQNQEAQQRLLELMQGRIQQPQVEQNPYDYNMNPMEWFRWENQKVARDVARQASEEARRNTREEITALMQQAQEFQWAQNHPGVDVSAVKAFARMNGIADWNLEAAHRLMTYPAQINQVAQTQAQQALQQFRQQPVGAQPLRGAQSAGNPQAGLRYDVLAKQFEDSNGLAYNSWPKEVQQAFDRETNHRYASGQ